MLREVFDFLTPTGKLILSCRSEFFKDAVEERVAILDRREHLIVTSGDLVQSTDDRGHVAYLSLLDAIVMSRSV